MNTALSSSRLLRKMCQESLLQDRVLCHFAIPLPTPRSSNGFDILGMGSSFCLVLFPTCGDLGELP